MSAIVRTPDHSFEFQDWRVDTVGDQVSMTLIAADGTSLRIDDRRAAEFLANAAAHYLEACDRAQDFVRAREVRQSAVIAMMVDPVDDEYALRNMVG
ncbi:hypothetical protein [Mycobacterium intracellulare]|uniref:Uncharacterized protein n=1 Tax=Mycobacterium intracellulare TaxID=1767 RepID=A0AAE4UAV0_MYCIT|nr:hypothetical protein [Mycobacterium intracellulare]MDV6979631.1 hypothetical protein [Mycobacterium intracellulare]MDV6985134.1 hypothetical protein [Mycobacterium intracellulare]MDV7014246.1 hypothetical protein [Mycobacterium intracellulare]MDV7030125.1 hypothetical protein [Mycobacterium intracellulare]